MILSSPSFFDQQTIPEEFTCDGQDISPALNWSGAPENTAQLALIMEDPDAPGGTWIHWVIYGIPGGCSGLEENIPADPQLPDGSCQGRNSWGRLGYGGPCPPSGTHRYIFYLYALKRPLSPSPGLTAQQLRELMRNNILAEATLIGLYQRKR